MIDRVDRKEVDEQVLWEDDDHFGKRKWKHDFRKRSIRTWRLRVFFVEIGAEDRSDPALRKTALIRSKLLVGNDGRIPLRCDLF